jgi:hypothetical protein
MPGCHPRTTSREVNIFTSQQMQTSGNCIVGISQIRYCPWCGEGFDVVRVK